jgi:hypothetical protein
MEFVDHTEFYFVAITALLMTFKIINKLRNSYSPKKIIKQEKIEEIPLLKIEEKVKKENLRAIRRSQIIRDKRRIDNLKFQQQYGMEATQKLIEDFIHSLDEEKKDIA